MQKRFDAILISYETIGFACSAYEFVPTAFMTILCTRYSTSGVVWPSVRSNTYASPCAWCALFAARRLIFFQFFSLQHTTMTTAAAVPKPAACQGCGKTFPSRNAVFRHLRETNGACLSPEEYDAFLQYVQTQQDLRKTIVLYGYLPTFTEQDSRESLLNGNDAARFMLEAMGCNAEKINRSYGCNVRGTDIVAQDEGTGAVCEVMTARLPNLTTSLKEWIDTVETKLCALTSGEMRVFGRLDMPQKRFNAEMDVTHVRKEYLLPADFLYTQDTEKAQCDFFEMLPNFCAGHQPHVEKNSFQKPKSESIAYLYRLKVQRTLAMPDVSSSFLTLAHLSLVQKLMRLMTTRIVDLDVTDASAVMEKEFHLEKRKWNRKKQQGLQREQGNGKNGACFKKKASTNGKTTMVETTASETKSDGHVTIESKSTKDDRSTNKTGTRVLRRRRFHNFTPRVMAHEYLAYRRLDRFYHRATLRYPHDNEQRPFLVLSLSGDLFLQGEALRVIGLWVALARNLIDVDIVDCIFDEEYPHLIPTPPVPTFALYAGEASYMLWEGKVKLILSPRGTDRYPGGWNNNETINAVADWQSHVHEKIAGEWMRRGADKDGRLVAEREWTEQVLEPWAEEAKEHLAEYRLWKASQSNDNGVETSPESILPALESIDATVPILFEKVLNDLRRADASGLWPSTTPKRQLVMVSTSTCENDSIKSLSAAHMRAKTNNTDRISAYDFTEGQGGASGSFSVGAFPGDVQNQPKANALFPELMKHAFELEIALCPDREPSSTIAINRNAQFRPHTDSGAGAGQSTSLIVGLGTYVGGELVVEGEKKDIRYKALEFNGWTQRHWTMPFEGERYSLVWFTPKGCEGMRGIDLCQD